MKRNRNGYYFLQYPIVVHIYKDIHLIKILKENNRNALPSIMSSSITLFFLVVLEKFKIYLKIILVQNTCDLLLYDLLVYF